MNTKTNLVIGTAIGYGLPEVSIFVKSFRAFNSCDDLALIVDSSIDAETAQFYLNNNVRLLIFESYKFIPTHIQNSRYIKYLEYLLENWSKYRHVFISDVRDNVFQGNIFEDLPKQCLYFFAEDDSDRIKNNVFNAGWIARNYGSDLLDKIGDGRIYCSGTTLGDYESMRRYLFYMLAQMDLDKIIALREQPGDMGSDQGYHNYLYYCSDLEITGKSNGDIVATLGTTLINAPDSVTQSNGLYYVNSMCPKVLHQYDRNAEMIRVFKSRYGC